MSLQNGFSPAGVFDDESQQIMNEAMALHNASQWQEAREKYMAVLERNPGDKRALCYLADAELQMGNIDFAIAQTNEIIKNDPTFIDAYEVMGEAFNRAKDYDRAMIVLNQANKILPGTSSVLHKIGRTYVHKEKYDEALKYFREILQKDPDHLGAIGGISGIYFGQGKFKKALPELERTIELSKGNTKDPTFMNALFNKVLLYGYLQQQKKVNEYVEYAKENYKLTDGVKTALSIVSMITAYEEGDMAACEQFIETCHGKQMENSIPNVELWNAFYQYIFCLIGYRQKNEQAFGKTAKDKIYLVGDSHSLSPSSTVINFRGQPHQCISKLVMGVQVRRLAQKGHNRYKEGLTTAFKSLPQGADAIITAGEIDCRMDYGVLPYFKKKERNDYEEYISEMVGEYIKNVGKIAKKHDIAPIFYGVPASNLKKSTKEKYSEEDLETQKKIIRIMNENLKEKALAKGYAFFDVYGFTGDDNGLIKAKESYLEEFHLIPSALDDIPIIEP